MIGRTVLRRLAALMLTAVLFSGCSSMNFAGLRQDPPKKSQGLYGARKKPKQDESWFSGWFGSKKEKKEGPQSVRDWMKEYKPMRLPGGETE